MYLESILFKRTETSEWEKGYYIGDTDNSDKSIIIDNNFIPLKDKDGCCCWDFCIDTENWLQFRADR